MERKNRVLKPMMDNLTKNVTKELQTTVAPTLIEKIKTRIKKNVNHTGGSFKDYTPTYASYKASKGLNERFVKTGAMLKGLIWSKISNGVRIHFSSGQKEKASKNYNEYGRPFLHINKDELMYVSSRIQAVIRKFIK